MTGPASSSTGTEQALLMRRLETAQNDCMAEGQAAAAILLQDARAEIARLTALPGASVCTCGGEPGQPANEHDISCPVAISDFRGAAQGQSGCDDLATKLEGRARKFLAEMNGVVTDANAAGYQAIPADVVGGYWKEDADIDLQAAEGLRGLAYSSANCDVLRDLPDYLDYLEQSLIDLDVDLKLPKNMLPPGIWAERIRALSIPSTHLSPGEG